MVIVPSSVNRALFLLAPLLVIAACSTTGPAPVADVDAAVGAEQAFASEHYEQAARLWQQEALSADPPVAGAYRVRAADAWLLADRPEQAEEILRWVKRSELSAADNALMDLVLADLALRHGRADEAEYLLEQASNDLPTAAKRRFQDLTARTLQQLSGPGARNIAQASRLSNSITNYQPESALELLESLELVSSGELAIRAENPRAEQSLTGWLDLALVIRGKLVRPDQLNSAIADWKSRHPFHVLSISEALDLWLRYRQKFGPPSRIAILLPGSGRLRTAGEAIRDGLMSAYLQNPGGSRILFFPTGDEPESAIAAYFQALDEGADLIIGPLQTGSITAMLNLAGLATPMLAMNRIPDDTAMPDGLSGQIFGLSLSQEQEVTAIARRAGDLGLERAIVLAPETNWGNLMAAAFEEAFLHEEHEIIAASRFPDDENDHGPTLERVLKIDESKARMTRLENTLRIPLTFEPSRRDDFDLFFMAASATQGRLIRPQLRFYEAGDVPVFATGRIYSGKPDRTRNQDLNGVAFPTTPWQLVHTSEEQMPVLDSIREGNLAALFAVGADAWNLLPWLGLMNSDPDFTFPGDSGNYKAGEGVNLKREPAWAQFSRGRPVPMAVKDISTTESANFSK
jgi:outer membrane PBP1 activator LpoA protein